MGTQPYATNLTDAEWEPAAPKAWARCGRAYICLAVPTSHNRRPSKDYERLCATSETRIYLASVRLLLRRLAHT
jgi:hypothetical protein